MFIKYRIDKIGINFIDCISKKSNKLFRTKRKALEIYKRTGYKIDMIAKWINPIVRG